MKDRAARHYELDAFERPHVLERIAVDGDDVGGFAAGNRAGLVGDVEKRGGVDGRGFDGGGGRHASLDQEGKFTRVLAEFWADDLVPGGNAGLLIGTNVGTLSPPIIFASSGIERMRILANGNIGIGTATPAAKLDVVGNINASGVIGAVYQDIAEWVPATTKVTPGTVVVLNPAASNEVMPSNRAYDTGVAGVVSGHPGVLLGRAGEGKAQIATTGRVQVMVDAKQGGIHVGDLLVTSDKPGMAMKSEPMDINGRIARNAEAT